MSSKLRLPRLVCAIATFACAGCGGSTTDTARHGDGTPGTGGSSPTTETGGTAPATGAGGANAMTDTGGASPIAGTGGTAATAGTAGMDAGPAPAAGGSSGAGDRDAGNPFVACDLLAQTGCGSGEKCAWKYEPGVDVIFCAPAGSVAPRGDCSFDALGNNDCAGGATCTLTGLGDADPNVLPRHLVCRASCATDADCMAPGDACLGFAASCAGNARCGASVPGGFCVPTCTPFGTECSPIGTCTQMNVDIDGATPLFVCRFAGTGTPGTPCNGAAECGADMTCGGKDPSNPTCVLLCDRSHPCPSGTACTTTGAGVGQCW